jgi:5-methyltetrahydrofolate--homocysteine methyltransferase
LTPNAYGRKSRLAAVRGVERLLVDLVTAPGKVKAALDRASAAYEDAVAELSRELGVAESGHVTRHGMYSPGYIEVLQCDFSCMISPEMFREFELPRLRREAALLSAAEYHLDGPDAVRHLEAVAEVEEIGVIQWQPGAGEAASVDWTPLHRQIDELGKGQVMFADRGRALAMARELGSNMLFFRTDAASRREAEALLRELEAARRG